MKKDYFKQGSRASLFHGFTMIELMIVLAIISALMGLVGPLAIDSFDKSQARVELLKFKNAIKKLSYTAFAQGVDKNVRLDGNAFIIFEANDNLESKRITYDHLFFQPQNFQINKNGYSLTSGIEIQVRGKTRFVSLDISNVTN